MGVNVKNALRLSYDILWMGRKTDLDKK